MDDGRPRPATAMHNVARSRCKHVQRNAGKQYYSDGCEHSREQPVPSKRVRECTRTPVAAAPSRCHPFLHLVRSGSCPFVGSSSKVTLSFSELNVRQRVATLFVYAERASRVAQCILSFLSKNVDFDVRRPLTLHGVGPHCHSVRA